MRILVYFPGDILVDRGTPLRGRNLARAIAMQPGVEALLMSRDDSAQIRMQLGLSHEHVPRDPGAADEHLRATVRRFAPQFVYGQTHSSMPGLASLKRTKRIVDLHGDVARDIWNQEWRPPVKRLWAMARKTFEERRFRGRVDAFTAVTHLLAAKWERLGKPIHVMWGGVDVEQFQPVARAASDRVHVVYAGNFRPYQGVSVLLAAARRLLAAREPFRFTLIGDVGPFPEVAREARAVLGEHGDVCGQVAYADVPARLGQADVLVIPRLPHGTAIYGFPSKLAEYLAMGKAIVVTNVGEHARVIKHMETGIVIPPSMPDALADALLELKNESLRSGLGRRAREFAVDKLCWPRIGGELLTFFSTLARS